jgi:MFS family permease
MDAPDSSARSVITAAATRIPGFRPVVRVAGGNFLEMYDFQIFGYYSAAIGRTFFPTGNDFASLMLSLATFGAGFLMRPIGAITLGAYIDNRGRRDGLLLTLGLMAVGTASIACMPSYASIGMMAPLLIVVGRLVQGLSAGVEAGGVSVYLFEVAPPGHKGLYASWQSASQQVAVMFAAVGGLVLTSRLTDDQMTRWGWRVPLLIGCMIIPVLFLLRRSLQETPEFLQRKYRLPSHEILRLVASNWKLVALGILLTIMNTVCFYLITAYTPTFGGTVLHLPPRDTMTATLSVGASNFLWLPIMGAVSDRIGRRPLLAAASALAVVTAYPALSWLVNAPSFSRLMAVELWFSFLFASYNSALIVFLTEIMPADIRTTGFSLVHSSATAIFGGFTPAISTYLIHATGNRAIPGLWLSCAAACGLMATALLSNSRVARCSVIHDYSQWPAGKSAHRGRLGRSGWF